MINGYGTAVNFLKQVEAVSRNQNGNTQQQWLPLAERPGVVRAHPICPAKSSACISAIPPPMR